MDIMGYMAVTLCTCAIYVLYVCVLGMYVCMSVYASKSTHVQYTSSTHNVDIVVDSNVGYI